FAVIPQGLIVTDDRYVYELDTPYLPYDVPHALRIYGEDGTLLLEEEMEIPNYWAIRAGRETVLVSEKNGKRYWYFDKSDIERGSLNWRSAALSPD
ncbi:MAG: hypothetical protein SOX31_03215, partial [Eubacteriales bacterium]|nr:hypothetical protein [Eubacteriales bacterium]